MYTPKKSKRAQFSTNGLVNVDAEPKRSTDLSVLRQQRDLQNKIGIPTNSPLSKLFLRGREGQVAARRTVKMECGVVGGDKEGFRH